ncbi:ArsR/SmtB family transcription factor [Flexibacterium corallicola]|uniref:ArsR/SmtB family transcription factor n=1 Tax=Flexibacterium corallicola TaxID=3037259 RepID=UPI00286EC025|nr:metalloregulator ArsR/SmtB family transcription factor [Pseudovibrio sp. M1P-2-3]
MDFNNATQAFAALSQETRLKVYKILMEYGSTGLAAGAISDQLGIPHNTLSFHLSHLSQAGLVSSRKEGRKVIYAANGQTVESLILFLRENCCSASQEANEQCSPILKEKP